MGSRTWIKIYCDRWLNGSIRDETPELRGVWVDLLVLAGSGKYGDSGVIKITDQVGYFDKQLAELLQISAQKWATCKKKLIQTDRVCVENNNIIVIKNWSKYQSEYDRQKVQRHESPKLKSGIKDVIKSSPESASKSAVRDRDKRLEKEKRDRDTPLNPPTVSLSQPSIEQVLEVYEQNICLNETISEDMENELKLAVKRFSASWVVDAIREAVLQNKPTWRYIAGILKNWQRYGKEDSL